MRTWEEWKESVEYLLSKQQIPYPGKWPEGWWIGCFRCNYEPEAAVYEFMRKEQPKVAIDVEAQRELLEAAEKALRLLEVASFAGSALAGVPVTKRLAAAIAAVRGEDVPCQACNGKGGIALAGTNPNLPSFCLDCCGTGRASK